MNDSDLAFAASWIKGTALVFALAGLGACALGSSDAPVAGGYSPLTFCSARASAECAPEVVKRCAVPQRDECIRVRTEDCVGRSPQGATVRDALAKTCVAHTAAAYADGKLTTDELRALHDDCDGVVWSGTGELKASCKVDSDCDTASGLRCVLPLGQPGTVSASCLRPHAVSAGDGCSGPADVCESGTFCDSASATCVVRRSEGQQCHDWLAPCEVGMLCPGSSSPFGSAKCTTRKPAGTPCAKDSECADDVCLRIAKTADGTCVSEVSLNAVDSMCATFKDSKPTGP